MRIMPSKAEQLGKFFIFVGGAARSGTTLVQNILDSHPKIYGTPEFQNIDRIIHLRNVMHKDVVDERIHTMTNIKDIDNNIRNFIFSFLYPLKKKSHAKYLSEKTPRNIFAFKELLEIFPQAKFIFVLRDPRAVITSLIGIRTRFQKSHEKPPEYISGTHIMSRTVKSSIQSGFDALKIAPERVLCVTYENIVIDTEGETKRICDFLGLSWSEKMLKPGEQVHPNEAVIGNREKQKSDKVVRWYDMKSYKRNVETASLYRWHTDLSVIDQFRVSKMFESMEALKPYGYDFKLKHLNPIQRYIGLAGSGIISALRFLLRLTNQIIKKLRNF